MYERNGGAAVRRKTTAIIAAAAAALGAVITLAGAGAASAAEYDYPAAIDPSSITVTTVGGGGAVSQWDQVRVDAEWSVPDGAVGGQTFGFTLPKEFARAGTSFSVPSAEDPSKTVAECTVNTDAAPVVTCTLTDYVNGRTGVSGSLWFVASADEQTTESTVEFTVDGTITPVEIPGGGIGPSSPLPTEPQKWSWQTDDGRIAWQLALPGASFAGAESIVVDDTLTGAGDGFAEHHNEDEQLEVWSTTMQDQDPQSITNWTGSWNDGGTAFHLVIPGPIDPTRMYFVKYFTVPSSQVDGATYANTADVNGIKLEDREVWSVTGGEAETATPPARSPSLRSSAAPVRLRYRPMPSTPCATAMATRSSSAPSRSRRGRPRRSSSCPRGPWSHSWSSRHRRSRGSTGGFPCSRDPM